MSILSGYGKYKRYILTSEGYKLCSQWTSSNTVEMGDGNTAETNLGSIKGITDSLTATSSNIALSASAGNNLQTQVDTLNSNLSECVIGNIPFEGVKMFAAFTTIHNAPANSYYEHSDNLETYLPSNAKIIFGVASILGTFNPYTEVSGVNVVLHDDSQRTIWFRIYNHLSYPVNLKIAYICFYIET